MIVQKGAFGVACIIFIGWIVQFVIQIHNHTPNIIPAFGTKMAPVFGTIMFNYAMVVTVPSWCNEKNPFNKY